MSFGSSPDPEQPKPAPVRIAPEVTKAKADLMAMLRKGRSRALSQVSQPGLLKEEPNISTNVLTDYLGG